MQRFLARLFRKNSRKEERILPGLKSPTKRMLDWCSPSRVLLCGTLLSLLLLAALIHHYVEKEREWCALKSTLLSLEGALKQRKAQEASRHSLRAAHLQKDPTYLERELGQLPLLQRERETLKPFVENNWLVGNEAVVQRYHFLSSKKNSLTFLEKEEASTKDLRESKSSLSAPVEVDTHDLKKVLHLLEGAEAQKPLLFISECALEKKSTPEGNEVWLLQLTLIKREFLS